MKHLALLILILFFTLPVFAQDAAPTVEATPAGDTVGAVETLKEANESLLALNERMALYAGGIVFLVMGFAGWMVHKLAQQGDMRAKQIVEQLQRAERLIPIDEIGNFARQVSTGLDKVSVATKDNVYDDVLSFLVRSGVQIVFPEKMETPNTTTTTTTTTTPLDTVG